MKRYALVLGLFLTACHASNDLTYDQLVRYQPSCQKKTAQLKELKEIQANKGFDQDLDKLSEEDRAYNSRLKATIWWYAYSCKNDE